MLAKLNQLKTILAEVSDLTSAAMVLNWDQQTYMPPGGARDRGHQKATLRRLAHQRFTSLEVGRLLEELETDMDGLDPDSDEARLVKVTQRRYQKQVKVPSEWVTEFAQATTVANRAWEIARKENDFPQFRPHLEKIVNLRRSYAQFFAPFEHIYDPLLDEFEPGMKTAEVQSIFDELRPRQVALIETISGQPQVEAGFLSQPFDQQKQWDFGVEVITKFGYDWARGRQDYTTHPFSINFNGGDVRITTRILPNFLPAGLFSTMHECGHALYGQGIDPAHDRTPLRGNASQAVSESQSRFWENIIGRSRPFWELFYPRLQEYFPSQLGNVGLEEFYRGINRVNPSLIRVEADEATYNLHIMLRLELEIALMEGSLEVTDLPDAWNSKMRDYLGLTPPDNSQGVLQDVHWGSGMIGYFPTYALGNLVSIQLLERMEKDLPNLWEEVRRGKFGSILAWLRDKIHRHGAKFEPQELVQRITGSKINPALFLSYLERKFGEIYKL